MEEIYNAVRNGEMICVIGTVNGMRFSFAMERPSGIFDEKYIYIEDDQANVFSLTNLDKFKITKIDDELGGVILACDNELYQLWVA